MAPSILDVAAVSPPDAIGAALAQLYALDGQRLAPVTSMQGTAAICPITLAAIQNPVLLGDGCIYEEAAAVAWLRDRDRSPCSGLRLPHKGLLRLLPLKESLECFLGIDGPDDQLKQAVERAELADVPLQARVLQLEVCVADATQHTQKMQASVDNANAKLTFLRSELSARQRHATLQLQTALRAWLARRLILSLQSQRGAPAENFCKADQAKEPLPRESAALQIIDRIVDRRASQNSEADIDDLSSRCTGSAEDVDVVIRAILSRVVADPQRCDEYVSLLCAIHVRLQAPTEGSNEDNNGGAESQVFMRMFLRTCQREFQRFLVADASHSRDDVCLLRKRRDCVSFVCLMGNLFVHRLLSRKTIDNIIQSLIPVCGVPEDFAVECACTLLQITGQTLRATPEGGLLMAEWLAVLDDLKHALGPSGAYVLTKGARLQVQSLMEAQRARA